MRLLDEVTANVVGPWIRVPPGNPEGQLAVRTFQASVVGTAGAQAATVAIQVTNDIRIGLPLPLATMDLAGTPSDTEGFASQAMWTYVRAVLTGLSGTGAKCTVTMGT